MPKTAKADAKVDAKIYLDQASAITKKPFYAGASLSVAVVQFILDTADINDQAKRNEVGKAFMALPSWFGCNASACRQDYGIKSTTTAMAEEYAF